MEFDAAYADSEIFGDWDAADDKRLTRAEYNAAAKDMNLAK
jgi:hypothetical protein